VKVVGFALVSCSRPPSDSAIRQGEGEADAMPGHVAVRMVAVVGIAAGTADGIAVGIAGAALPLEKFGRVVHQRDAFVDDVDGDRFRWRIPDRDRHRPAAVLRGVVQQHRQDLAGAGSREIADRSGFGDGDA